MGGEETGQEREVEEERRTEQGVEEERARGTEGEEEEGEYGIGEVEGRKLLDEQEGCNNEVEVIVACIGLIPVFTVVCDKLSELNSAACVNTLV